MDVRYAGLHQMANFGINNVALAGYAYAITTLFIDSI
jgi:hypothetical protein